MQANNVNVVINTCAFHVLEFSMCESNSVRVWYLFAESVSSSWVGESGSTDVNFRLPSKYLKLNSPAALSCTYFLS